MSSLSAEASPGSGQALSPPLVPSAKKPVKSHHAYATATFNHLTRCGHAPVLHEGQLFVLDPERSIWGPFDKEELVRIVAERNDGQYLCIRRTDYVGIADQVLSLATTPAFFEKAPDGLACSGSFYRVQGGDVRAEPLSPDHRQRVMLEFEPTEEPTPYFEQFLHETFRSDLEGEEDQQRQLLQEIAGGILLGLLPRFHKAVLFYDPYGRAGKSTLERIISQLVPTQFTSAVSPFKWGHEYYLAELVGSRLNVVGELPEGDAIPAAEFKKVLGGDLLAGRQPTKPVISFHNEAAHLFTSNHLPTTREHTSAFFERWLLLEFPNSLLLSSRKPDSTLAERIISQEMAGIAHWALQGGARLLAQGEFSRSVVHDRLMAKWRRTSSSVDEFIHECCELQDSAYERRSDFYVTYKSWCNDNGRKPLSKGRVKEFMEHRIGLNVRFAVLDGYEVVRGIAVKEAFRDHLTAL